MKRRYEAMLKIDGLDKRTLREAADALVRIGTMQAQEAVRIEAIKALVQMAARPVSITGCNFTGNAA